jgi:HAD superfamily hydrolase (TIGR01509 family)
LFDMDGTLVDSEKVWDVGLREMAAGYGGVLSEAARLATIGTSSPEAMQILHADLGQPWRDPVAAAARLDARVMELFAEGLEWLPGARELLRQVRSSGLRTALVTNTVRTLTDIALGTIGAANFDVIVCGDEVVRAKPDPAPYLAAAAALGVDLARCVAIEDSPAGVASALAAGCAVLAVPHAVEFSAADFSAADVSRVNSAGDTAGADVSGTDVAGADPVVLDSLLDADLDLLRSMVRPAFPLI